MILSEIKWIMFDLDNTLVDFSIASKKALSQTCTNNNIEFNDNFYAVYKKINDRYWQEFEAGKTTAMQIRKLRFTDTFNELGITGLDGFSFNAEYLQQMVTYTTAYEGVIELLEKCKPLYTLSIVTNGLKEVQRARLELLDMTSYFESIIVSDEIGYSKPSSEYFDIAVNSVDNNIGKKEILVVGDNLKSDIHGANNYGLQSCWVSQGKINDTGVIPDHTIHAVSDLLLEFPS